MITLIFGFTGVGKSSLLKGLCDPRKCTYIDARRNLNYRRPTKYNAGRTWMMSNLIIGGFGWTMIEPVVNALLGNENDIIGIEYPETGLHPKVQVELGDLLIESHKLGNTIFVETHSEHLMLRILRRIREHHEDKDTPCITPKDVTVIYITKDGENVTLEINDEGDFTSDWPDGFFDERMAELF